MEITEFVKKELSGWKRYETVSLFAVLAIVFVNAIIVKDNPIAVISAFCGILYTVIAGKGKISCYFFGLSGSWCYVILSFGNALWGNMLLYLFYYIPMQVLGIFKWKQHLKKDSQEIEKTELSKRDGVVYLVLSALLTFVAYVILYKIHDQSPIIDSITTVFSVIGMILTVKRCIEQWYVWFVVNGLSVVMWIKAYALGSNCFATILMWAIYFVLSIYFLYTWKKELNGRLK